MGDFSHVSDEGVRAYLEGPPSSDYYVVAAQLDHAVHSLKEDWHNQDLSFYALEHRWRAYEEASDYFGYRNMSMVQRALQSFWRV